MRPHRYVIALVLILIPHIAYPATRQVPGDYPTIQAAIDAAGDGDTLLIADGIYSGTGNFDIYWDANQKHLVIRSEHGRDHCIIDCMEQGRGFVLDMGQDNRDVIDGLTITNGYGRGNAGGGILIDSTSPRIINCMLIHNSTGGDMDDVYYGGGAITVYGNASPIIQGNIIRGNYSGAGGGGVSFSNGASGVLENNIIDGNETHGDGGGIAHYYNSSPLIINNLIINNFSRGHYGGGIFSYISNPSVINCTIAFNTTYIEYFPGEGGGIGAQGKPFPVFRNCLIWNNISSSYTMNVYWPSLTWMDISYSNVENDLGHIFDLKPYTNIDSLPGFLDPDHGNFQLVGSSPCINMGTPDTTGLSLPWKDLSGNDRIIGGRVDIGAYENRGPTTTPHINDGTGFRLYPNPCSGLLFMECGENMEYDDLLIRICNVRGELVGEEKVDTAKPLIPINISDQPDGFYILTLTSRQSVLFRQKVIKE